MSMRVYEFSNTGGSKKVRFCEPYGGGYGTYISAYWLYGVTTNYRFYHYKSYSSGLYRQEFWRQTVAGSWFRESLSDGASLSSEPYTSGWTMGDQFLLATVTLFEFYTANITANAYGTVSRAKLFYDASAQRSATATPNEGSSFIGWFLTGTETQVTTNDDFTVASNVITLKRNPVSADIAVEARFTAVYLLTTSTNSSVYGEGYVGDDPSTDKTKWLVVGVGQNIRAVVTDENYKFSKWTLDGADFSTSASVQITTGAAAKTYVAVFIPIKYTLDVTLQNAAHGTVSVDGQLPGVTTGLQIVSLSQVTVRATPAFGYVFLDWHVAGVAQNKSAAYSFSMPESDLAIEARFVAQDTAEITITKTKGDAEESAAKDRGSVSQYHLDTVFDVTSDVGTATLVSSLFITSSYKFVPAPADDTYQFDGWYQTVNGSEVAITTGGIFTLTGTTLYVLPTTTDAIAVNAQFSERSNCTIAAVASNSSTYESGNAAYAAGCRASVTDPAPDITDPSDAWFSGQPITVLATQAPGWELRSWKIKDEMGELIDSISKGDADFGQAITFNLLVNVQVVAVSAYTLPADRVQIQVLLKSGQPLDSGTLEIHPCGDSYIELANGATANVEDGEVCEITAIPANGYRFVGWRIASEGASILTTIPVYSFAVSGNAVFYAEFEAATEEALVLFEGGTANRQLTWASKTFVASVPSCFSSARVYADAYPVRVQVGMSDNPSHPANAANVESSIASSQSPFRLPMRRPRKSIVIVVEAVDTVSEVSIATSMEGLKNG